MSDRVAWLTRRREGIGASDVAAIVGRSPFGSPWSVWVDKVGLAPLDDAGSPAMLLGRDLEPVIARWFENETGLHVTGEQTMRHHPDGPWFATLDGLVVDGPFSTADDALGVFEAKYSGGAPWPTVPEHYVIQVQWAMFCASLDQAWVAAMHLPFGRPDFRVHQIARDDIMIAALRADVERFWNEHVVTGIPPLVDAHPATEEALRVAAAAMHPETQPIVDLADLADEISDLRTLDAAVKDAQREMKRIKAQLRARLLEVSEGCVGGVLAVSYREQIDRRIDVDAVRADHGDKYDREAPVRVLRLHDPTRRHR